MDKFTKIYVSEQHLSDAKRWCRENIGPAKPDKTWNSMQWYHRRLEKMFWRTTPVPGGLVSNAYLQDQNFIYIRDEQMAVLFALRWS